MSEEAVLRLIPALIFLTTNSNESSRTFKEVFRLVINVVLERKGNIYGGATRSTSRISAKNMKQRAGRVARLSAGVVKHLLQNDRDRDAHESMEQMPVFDYLELLAKDEVHLLNVVASPLDTRMGLKIAYEMGLASTAGNEEPPSPREKGCVPYPDYMQCKDSALRYNWWELLGICEAVDEFIDTDSVVKRG